MFVYNYVLYIRILLRNSSISWALPEPTPYSAWLRYFCVKTFTTLQPIIDSAKLFASCKVKLSGYVTRTTSMGFKTIQPRIWDLRRLKEIDMYLHLFYHL